VIDQALRRKGVAMPSSCELSERDLRALMAVVEDGRRDEPGPGLPWVTLERLRDLIGCDNTSLCEHDLRRERTPLEHGVEDGERLLTVNSDDHGPEGRLFWQLYRSFQPCHDPTRPGSVRVIRWSDVYSQRELHNEPLYIEFFRPGGSKHNMFVELPARPEHTRRLLFWRCSGRDFSYRDKLILELLWPHLWEVYQDAELRRRGIPQLTRREWEVLQLAAQGNSNADIARLLFISLSTVRKHMEHIFDQTGVRTRTAAVARMMPRLTMRGGQPIDTSALRSTGP
jgi:DNA-binding CsgD family transcriptional regulator